MRIERISNDGSGVFHDDGVQVLRKVAVLSLFKLEIWKALGKPCPVINYR